MTPKEKAKELYCKYTDALNIRDLQTTANPFAKQCAIIAVDEILNLEPPELSYLEPFSKSWWQEVKKQIKNL